ncbi:MAG: hypothetical protein RL572_339, partial [Pseudomonadota bacterium]
MSSRKSAVRFARKPLALALSALSLLSTQSLLAQARSE